MGFNMFGINEITIFCLCYKECWPKFLIKPSKSKLNNVSISLKCNAILAVSFYRLKKLSFHDVKWLRAKLTIGYSKLNYDMLFVVMVTLRLHNDRWNSCHGLGFVY